MRISNFSGVIDGSFWKVDGMLKIDVVKIVGYDLTKVTIIERQNLLKGKIKFLQDKSSKKSHSNLNEATYKIDNQYQCLRTRYFWSILLKIFNQM